jgi:hypothetical protein
MNMGKLAPVALSVGLLGIVGGVAAASAFQSTPKPVTHLVQPAAQTVTVTPSPTTTTVAPRPVKVVKAVVAPAPVQSTQAVAPAPAPVQQKAVAVSTDTSTSSTPPPAPPEPVKRRDTPVPGVVTDPPQVIGIPTTETPTPTATKAS